MRQKCLSLKMKLKDDSHSIKISNQELKLRRYELIGLIASPELFFVNGHFGMNP